MIPWQTILETEGLIGDILVGKLLGQTPEVPLFDIMFYTGGTDMANKHIYRLDILRQENLLYLVSWFPDRLQWWAQGLGTAPDKPLYELSIQNDIFVVGNGHENPELLKILNT